MRADGVVVPPPLFDDDLGFSQRVEDLTVEQLVSELAVEAFIVAVLPRAAWFDEERADAQPGEPFAKRRGDELRAVVGPDVGRRSMLLEQVRHGLKDVLGMEPAGRADGQAFPRILVNHGQQAKLAAVMGAILHEVVGPDVMPILRPQPHARAVVEPEPASPGLSAWNFQALAPPDPLDPLVVRLPALTAQQRRDPAIAIAAIARCQIDDRARQSVFVIPPLRPAPLRRANLAGGAASPAL